MLLRAPHLYTIIFIAVCAAVADTVNTFPFFYSEKTRVLSMDIAILLSKRKKMLKFINL